MPKKINIDIKESESELQYQLRKQSKPLQKSRVRALLLIKQGKVEYTSDLASTLKRSRRSIYTWLSQYEKDGIESFLHVQSRGSRKEKLNAHTKKCLEEKLNDPHTDITSYVELLQWTRENCQKEVPYYALYHYCRTKLNGRLKIARKSHHNKDEQAVAAFKKTTGSNQIL